MTDSPTTLARVDHARQLLAEARTIDEVKDVRDKAEAIRQYYRTAGFTVDIQNYAAEIKIRAERKAGELLAERERPTGNRHTLERDTASRSSGPPTLAEIGITRKQSARFQEVAAIPEPVFEEVIAETKAKAADALAVDETPSRDAVLTTAGITRVAQQKQAEQDEAMLETAMATVPGAEEKMRVARLRHAVAKGVQASRELFRIHPESAAEVISEADYTVITLLESSADQWFKDLAAARAQGLRLIQGGR